MPEIVKYFYRGGTERGTGEPGYKWHAGYSANSEDGLPLQPWSTRRECQREAKAEDKRAVFVEQDSPEHPDFKPVLAECPVCGAFHPKGFMGDCRDDANRYNSTGDYKQRMGREAVIL